MFARTRLPNGRFHVGQRRDIDVELEPVGAAIVAAEQIAVALGGVHVVGIGRIEGEAFDEAAISLGEGAVELFPAFAGVAGLDLESLRAGVAFAPLSRLAVGDGGIEHVMLGRMHRQRH